MVRGRSSSQLAVRVRRSFAGDGEATISRTVRCERRGDSVPLETCQGCDQCGGVTLDETKLTCNWPHPRPQSVSALGSLAKRMFPQIAHETSVAQVMTPRVLCVRPERLRAR